MSSSGSFGDKSVKISAVFIDFKLASDFVYNKRESYRVAKLTNYLPPDELMYSDSDEYDRLWDEFYEVENYNTSWVVEHTVKHKL